MAVIICPFLGIEEDAETAVAFPSPRNRCFRSGEAAVISTVQQDHFCLKDAYAQCPVYLLKQQAAAVPPLPVSGAAKPASATSRPTAASKPAARPGGAPKPPPPARAAAVIATRPVPPRPTGGAPSRTRRIKDTVIAGLMGGGVMAILLAAILILPAYGARLFAPGPNAIVGQPTGMGDRQSGVISQPTEGVVASPTLTDTPEPTRTVTATTTTTATRKPTLKPSRTATRRATDSPYQQPAYPTTAITCGVPYGWVAYIVQPGDTLISLARRTNTTISQLQAANCMGYSTLLYAGMNFYLPYLPAPEIPTTAPPSSTPAPTATKNVPAQTAVPSSTPVPVIPSPTTVPPTVMPSPVLPTATPVTPEPGSVDPTNAQTGRGG